MDIGNRIKTEREKRKISKSELARKIEVSPAYITMLENGKKKNPTTDLLRKICLVFEMDMYDLVLDEDTKIKLEESNKEYLEDIIIKNYTGYIYHLYNKNHPDKVFNFNNEEVYRSFNEVNKFTLFVLDKIEKERRIKENQKDFEEFYNNLKRGE